jgi:CheY-like chemotaxis protein
MNQVPQRHVLVIDTDPAVLLAVHDVLEWAGYRVSLLSHFNHDLIEVKRVSPDLIVLDYRWGSDDNGWSLLQLLRLDPETVDIPIVLCTGAVRELEALNDHLSTVKVTGVIKPFVARSLLAAIAEALAEVEPPLTVTNV